MIDKKLKGDLKKNASAILDIMERNGIDVSRYRKLAEEQKQKEKRDREKAKIYRANYKGGNTAFLNIFAYSEIREEEKQQDKEKMQVLKDCLLMANENENELKGFLTVAKAIKSGKTPYYRKVLNQQLKSLSKPSIVLKKKIENRKKIISKTKSDFMKYYCENWFFMLLDIMKKIPREKGAQ